MSEIQYEFICQFSLLSNCLSDSSTELNLISWNDREPDESQFTAARLEPLRGRESEVGRQVNGLLESPLTESFGGG